MITIINNYRIRYRLRRELRRLATTFDGLRG
jgi:predicted kinase